MLFASKTTLLQSIELAPGPDLSAWPMPDGELVLHFVWCCRWHKHDRLLSSESAPKERNELISRNESTQVVNTVNVLGFVVEIMILMDQTICILSLIKTNRYIFLLNSYSFFKAKYSNTIQESAICCRVSGVQTETEEEFIWFVWNYFDRIFYFQLRLT